VLMRTWGPSPRCPLPFTATLAKSLGGAPRYTNELPAFLISPTRCQGLRFLLRLRSRPSSMLFATDFSGSPTFHV
jgi:hypothetical protein